MTGSHSASATRLATPAADGCKIEHDADVAALLARARRLAGLTLHELSVRLAVPLPSEPKRVKGYIGRLIEQALGVVAGGAELKSHATDFPELGVELKTLPVDVHGRPRESTFVCHVDLKLIAECEWHDSRACEKLSRVLFVPIESGRHVDFAMRRIGAAFLWTPSAEECALLKADYDEIAGRVGTGDVEGLSGRVGRVLQVRPKAPNARTRTRAADADGASQATFPRAFYLRASFTEQIVAAALGISSRDRTVF